MSLPPVPPEATLRAGESLVGEWEYPLELRDAQVARIDVRYRLTSERLLVLEYPTARTVSRIAGRLSLRKSAQGFRREMDRWHVALDARLKDLPEPTLGQFDPSRPTALPSHRALIVGDKHFPVSDGPAAEAMASVIRGQWAAAHRSGDAPLG